MNIQILENTPRSLKLRYSQFLESFIVFFSLFILGFILFLFSGYMLVLSFINKEGSMLIGSLSLFFTVIGALWVRFVLRSILSEAHGACILHFDQITKKLNLYPQTILRKKLPAVEIPFAQLDKIEFKEIFHTGDTDHLTYAIDLKTKDKSVWATTVIVGFVMGGAEWRRHEVEEVARLISEITGIPYTFSTDKPLPEKP